MRAFKKLMAGAIATAIAATLATSAFAAGFDATTGKVGFATATEGEYDYTAVGQTTVLVVPADVWVEGAITGLEDADILYIDQYEDAATANTAIAAGFGVKLDEEGTLAVGNYYALFGGNTGTAGAFAISAVPFEVKAASTEPETPVIVLGDLTGDSKVEASDLTVLAKILAKMIAQEAVTDAQISAGNVDKADGVESGYASLTASDLTKLAKYLAKMISSLE